MLRYILWSILAAYLIAVGLFPAALAPVHLAAAGAAALIAAVPAPLLVLAGVAVWLKYRPASAPKAAV
jgi:hypothetical protein